MATMAQVFAFFKTDGYTLSAFRKDWAALNDSEKAFFKTEVGATL
jgi:hypothetical protein